MGLKPWLGLLALCTAAAPPARAGDTYRGQLYCRNVMALWTQPSVVDLIVVVQGAAATFERVSESDKQAGSVALFESGGGQVSGAAVTLQGAAETASFSMRSRYDGEITTQGIVLHGTQAWQGAGLNETVLRDCDGRLGQ